MRAGLGWYWTCGGSGWIARQRIAQSSAQSAGAAGVSGQSAISMTAATGSPNRLAAWAPGPDIRAQSISRLAAIIPNNF